MAVQQLMDRVGKLAILAKFTKGTPHHFGKLFLNGQPDCPLQSVQFLIQINQCSFGFCGRQCGLSGHADLERSECGTRAILKRTGPSTLDMLYKLYNMSSNELTDQVSSRKKIMEIPIFREVNNLFLA